LITIARNLAIDMVRSLRWKFTLTIQLCLNCPMTGPTALELIETAEAHRSSMQQEQKVLSAFPVAQSGQARSGHCGLHPR